LENTAPARQRTSGDRALPHRVPFFFPHQLMRRKADSEMCVAQKHHGLRFPKFMSGTQI
jgi:hypothetical protein